MKRVFVALGISTPVLYYSILSEQKKRDVQGIGKSIINSGRAATILFRSIYDYMYELGKIEYNTDEYHKKRSEIHYRVAERILELSKKNRGIYLKLGQYLGNLEKVMPREFTEVLSILQDSAPILPFQEIKVVVQQDLQAPIESYFKTFDKKALAAASLAQVHHAVLNTGQQVAVKIQYPFLRKSTEYDLKILTIITQYCSKLMQKSGSKDIDILKLFNTWTQTLVQQLDFTIQVQNALKSKENFKNDKSVYIPIYYKNLSSKRLITMQYVQGAKINNKEGIQKLGLDPEKVAKILVRTFGRMIFQFRHIHCDAHPGNIFVRKNKDGEPQIVLLDHGLYRQVDKDFLKNFGKLWLALVGFNKKQLNQAAVNLNVQEHKQFLPLIFLHRTMESTRPLGASITDEDRKYLRQRDLANFQNVNKLLQDLPPQLMFIIRATNLVVSHSATLGLNTRYRLFLYTGYSLKVAYPSFIRRCFEKICLYIRVFLFQHAQWLFRSLYSSYLITK